MTSQTSQPSPLIKLGDPSNVVIVGVCGNHNLEAVLDVNANRPQVIQNWVASRNLIDAGIYC